MTNVALIFPGQGAQYVGMGKEFYEYSKEAKEIFDQADQIFKNNFKEIIFEGPSEKLTATAYCQPAILTFSIASLKAFQSHPISKQVQVQYTAGLSLGEYSALVASGALSFQDTIKLVERRSFFMEEAIKEKYGKMAAIIGLEQQKIMEVCEKTGAEIANFNSLQQIVITGEAAKVERACQLLKENGAKSVIPLEVSGAFHSSLMRSAAERFSNVLAKVKISPAKIPVVSNVDGQPTSDSEKIRQNLSKQIISSVQWVKSIQFMKEKGIQCFIEIGPGKVLSGLIRRIDPALKTFNIEKPADIEKVVI